MSTGLSDPPNDIFPAIPYQIGESNEKSDMILVFTNIYNRYNIYEILYKDFWLWLGWLISKKFFENCLLL